MRAIALKHKFVTAIPEQLEDGVLYVSLEYRTVTHKCCCGCGHEVVTPLSPTDWKLTFDGISVSLYPSIGNWSLACRSHYWIKNDAVEWSYQMSDAEIAAGRSWDRIEKTRQYGKVVSSAPVPAAESGISAPVRNNTIWDRFTKLFWG